MILETVGQLSILYCDILKGRNRNRKMVDGNDIISETPNQKSLDRDSPYRSRNYWILHFFYAIINRSQQCFLDFFAFAFNQVSLMWREPIGRSHFTSKPTFQVSWIGNFTFKKGWLKWKRRDLIYLFERQWLIW